VNETPNLPTDGPPTDSTPAYEAVSFTPPKPSSGWKGGCIGCLAGGSLALVGIVACVTLLASMQVGRGVAVAVIAPLVLAAAAWAYRRYFHEDRSLAIGILTGITLAAIVAGFCASL
jgi:hypothetical protein